MKNSISQLDQAYEICRKETQKWAKTFYLGTLLLPIEKRKAIWAIYVWCRRTDEIMDSIEASTKSQDELSDNLNAWEENTKNVFQGNIKSIKTAVLWKKKDSTFEPDYCAQKLDSNPWIVQPFEHYEEIRVSDLIKKHQKS